MNRKRIYELLLNIESKFSDRLSSLLDQKGLHLSLVESDHKYSQKFIVISESHAAPVSRKKANQWRSKFSRQNKEIKMK